MITTVVEAQIKPTEQQLPKGSRIETDTALSAVTHLGRHHEETPPPPPHPADQSSNALQEP